MTKPYTYYKRFDSRSKRFFVNLCQSENHSELLGVTDGKAVGTYVEHKFQQLLI